MTLFARALVLTLVVVIVGFILYAGLTAWRRGMQHRWAWVLLCLVGVMRFDFGWRSGMTALDPFAIVLLGVGFTKASGTWIIHLGFPAGALLAIGKARMAKAVGEKTDSAPM